MEEAGKYFIDLSCKRETDITQRIIVEVASVASFETGMTR